MNKEKYMTLKEASEKSGYSADYIGQLIRNGKLSGKQIYSGVAWVTTEEALDEYLKDSRGNKKSRFYKLFNFENAGGRKNVFEHFYRIALYVVIFLGALLIVALFYILALKLERSFELKGIQQIESTNS